MKFLELCFVLLCWVILDSSLCVDSEYFTVYRNEGDFGDKFDIPNITCTTIISSSKCSQYGASNRSEDQCLCKCPSSNATFTFHNGAWGCIGDRIIRESEGCKVTFDNDIGQFKTLKKGTALRTVNLREAANQNCIVDVNTSKYLGCNGTWHPLQMDPTLITIFPSSGLFLKVMRGINSSQVDGRLIKLSFTGCELITATGGLCLLFKLKGNYACEAPFKPAVTASPTERIPTTVEHSIPVGTSSAGIQPSSTGSNPTISMSLGNPSGPRATSQGSGVTQTEIIVIAVSANVVLITIIAILSFVMCRMRRRNASMSDVSDESPYAEIPFGDDSILVGNHAYARLYSTRKKKIPHPRRELEDLKNFPNPSFEDVPYEIPLPPPANGQNVVYSYAVPDLPEVNTMPPLRKPGTGINPENRESVASSCFSYDYAVPDSPKGMTSIKEQEENPHPDISDTPDVLSKPDKPSCDSKGLMTSVDSMPNRDSEEGPYYHVLDPNQSASTSNLTENDSNAGKSTPYDCPEAVINAAFEGLKEHESDTQPNVGKRNNTPSNLSINDIRYPQVLEEFNLSEFSDYSSQSDYERKTSIIEEEDDEDNSGGSSCNPEVPERTKERLLEPFDSSSEHSSEVKAYSDTSSFDSATRDDRKEEASCGFSVMKAYGDIKEPCNQMDSEIQEIEINLEDEENAIQSSYE